MTKKCIMVMLAFLMLGIAAPARATLYADFWAADIDGDGVTLDFSLFSTPAKLWFSTDKHNWVLLSSAKEAFSSLKTSLTLEDTTHLFLKLDLLQLLKSPTAPTQDSSASSIVFNGASGNNLYNSLSIQWTGSGSPFSLSFITPEGGDKVTDENPAEVPIPPSALLFSTGLLSFIAVRRKLGMRSA
jgi:hypothetical protein